MVFQHIHTASLDEKKLLLGISRTNSMVMVAMRSTISCSAHLAGMFLIIMTLDLAQRLLFGCSPKSSVQNSSSADLQKCSSDQAASKPGGGWKDSSPGCCRVSLLEDASVLPGSSYGTAVSPRSGQNLHGGSCTTSGPRFSLPSFELISRREEDT